MATEILKPTAFTGDAEWVDTALAYDGVSAGDNGTYAYSNGTSDNVSVWYGFPNHNQLVLTSFKLFITSEFLGTTSNDIRNVQYSPDDGATWNMLFDCSAETAKNTQSWDLNFEGDPTQLRVGVEYDRVAGSDNGLESRIWDIYIEAIGEDVPALVLDATRSRDASLTVNTVINTVLNSNKIRGASLVYDTVLQAVLNTSRYRISNGIFEEVFPVSYNCNVPMICVDTFPCYNGAEVETPDNFIPLYMSAF